MLITTADTASDEIITRAKELAARFGARYVPRGRVSVSKLLKKYDESESIVLTENAIRLISSEGEPMEYHPSMGYVRAKRLLKGESDPMIDVSRMKPGDTVMDCTAGLGSDSLVFSVYGGPGSRVIASENSRALAALLSEGLSYYCTSIDVVNEAMRRIEVVQGHHLELLRGMPDRSVDVIYFDPMFREPVTESAAIEPLRDFANHDALSIMTIEEAKRVARKTIVLKEKKESAEFARLGFLEQSRPHSKISYGVISLDSNDQT